MDCQPQDMQRVSLKKVLKERGLWLLVLLGILYFHRPLFLGETFYFRELNSFLLPHKQLFVDFIASGELPLWDPYMQGGLPYLANIGNSALYPSNFLYLFLPFFRAFNLNIVLHLILCSVFPYLFSRVIGLQPISSFIVGIVYGFCGYTLSFTNLVGAFMAVPYLPLLLLFWHLYMLEGKPKWFTITVIVGVIRVFAGAPEANIIGMLFLLGWILFYPYSPRAFFRRFVLWLLLGIFIVGISSVQILPTLEMILLSPRGQKMAYLTFSYWSLYLKRLPELVFPEFFGSLDTLLPHIYYWGGEVMDENTPYILSIYFGGAALALAVIGGLYKGDNRVVPRRMRIFLFLLFALFLPLSLGRFLPFFHLLYQYIPLISFFRYPIKFLSIGVLPLALLAGYASEVHFGALKFEAQGLNPEPVKSIPSRCLLAVLWGVAALLLVFTAAFLLSSDFASYFQEMFFKQAGGDIARRGLGRSFVHASAIWLLFTLLYHYRGLKPRSWQHWFLACILIADLLSAGRRVNPTTPEEIFTDLPPVVQIIRDEIGEGRLFRTATPSEYILRYPSNDVFWRYRWGLEVLEDYRATFYRIPVIFHGGLTFSQTRLQKLRSVINSLPWERRLPLLSAGGVTLILTSDDISIPGIRRIAEIPNRSNVPLYLYQNETAAARVEFVTLWKLANSDTEALKMMLSPGYDLRKQVVLQKSESTLFEMYSRTPEILMADSNFSECDSPLQIKKITSNTHSALFSVSNHCDGYLVFSEPFYPGWRVYVDGKPTPILRANSAFSAIFLPAGEHEVKRFYRSNSLLVGIISSVMFCGIFWGVMHKYKGLQKI